MVIRIVGVTHEGRQEMLARISEHPEQWTVGIVRHPHNPYDRNALAVIARNAGGEELHVGYINRELAARWKHVQRFVVTQWRVVGGEKGRKYGMELGIIPLDARLRLDAERRQHEIQRQLELATQLAAQLNVVSSR